jgi:hypothetical protein
MTKPSRQQRCESADDLGDVSDLPKELVSQLVACRENGHDGRDMVLAEIARRGGRASVDELLVGIWRTHKIVWKRRELQGLLYRMKSARLLIVIVKGVYALPESARVDRDQQLAAMPRQPTIEMIVAGTEAWLCEAAMEERAGICWAAMFNAYTSEAPERIGKPTRPLTKNEQSKQPS